jgi:hypothetical protein
MAGAFVWTPYDWHPTNGFDALILCLFTGAAYASTGFKMNDVNIVDIGLRIIKQCGMYGKEYKAWIACKEICPRIVETVDTFKTFWAAKITLINRPPFLQACMATGWPP